MSNTGIKANYVKKSSDVPERNVQIHYVKPEDMPRTNIQFSFLRSESNSHFHNNHYNEFATMVPLLFLKNQHDLSLFPETP